jgi:hypothetical protein
VVVVGSVLGEVPGILGFERTCQTYSPAIRFVGGETVTCTVSAAGFPGASDETCLITGILR